MEPTQIQRQPMMRSDSNNSFRAPSGSSAAFFQSRRNVAKQDPKLKKGDVPTLVIPTLAQKERGSKTPRGDHITLPAISSARSGTISSQKGASFAGPATDRTHVRGKKPRPPPVKLPKLTFRTNYDDDSNVGTPRGQQPPLKLGNNSARFLNDYDGGNDPEDIEKTSPDQHIAAFEASGPRNAGESSYHNVTTIDEEASARVLKVIFQLGLTKNSPVIAKLRELETEVLQKRVMQEVGHKKQMSREEFHVMLQKVLRNEYISRRDSNTLFSVFDDDKSGLVDAVEFVGGFTSLVGSGSDDVAFKFLALLMEGREKSTMNAFLSRFELSILIEAAQSFYNTDPEILRILEDLPSRFNFSHHMGRIPVMEFRNCIRGDEDLRVIFESLPNPSKTLRELPNMNASLFVQSQEANELLNSDLVADQYINQNNDVQRVARETDSPKWWSMGGTVYRSSAKNPYPEPVFMRDGNNKAPR